MEDSLSYLDNLLLGTQFSTSAGCHGQVLKQSRVTKWDGDTVKYRRLSLKYRTDRDTEMYTLGPFILEKIRRVLSKTRPK